MTLKSKFKPDFFEEVKEDITKKDKTPFEEQEELIKDKEKEFAKSSSTTKILAEKVNNFTNTLKDFHNHDGINSLKIDINNLNNFIETVTTIPTSKPRYFWEQFKIYINDLETPTTKRLYIYSNKAKIWNYVTLT